MASLLTSQASAQNSHVSARAPESALRQVALARALFEEGVALGDKGDWAGAADRFGRAYALKPTSGIAFNWASALSVIGRLTQASELLEGVSRDPKAAPELKQDSNKKLAEIAPRRPRLKLHVDPSIADEGSVRVDGNAWPQAVWDVAIPIDPGAHVATASRGDRELARAEISLAEGEQGELSLGGAESAQTGGAETSASARQSTQTSQSDRKPLYKNWILWTCVGAVAVGGIVAAVVATRSHGSEREAPVMGNAGAGVIRW